MLGREIVEGHQLVHAVGAIGQVQPNLSPMPSGPRPGDGLGLDLCDITPHFGLLADRYRLGLGGRRGLRRGHGSGPVGSGVGVRLNEEEAYGVTRSRSPDLYHGRQIIH